MNTMASPAVLSAFLPENWKRKTMATYQQLEECCAGLQLHIDNNDPAGTVSSTLGSFAFDRIVRFTSLASC